MTRRRGPGPPGAGWRRPRQPEIDSQAAACQCIMPPSRQRPGGPRAGYHQWTRIPSAPGPSPGPWLTRNCSFLIFNLSCHRNRRDCQWPPAGRAPGARLVHLSGPPSPRPAARCRARAAAQRRQCHWHWLPPPPALRRPRASAAGRGRGPDMALDSTSGSRRGRGRPNRLGGGPRTRWRASLTPGPGPGLRRSPTSRRRVADAGPALLHVA